LGKERRAVGTWWVSAELAALRSYDPKTAAEHAEISTKPWGFEMLTAETIAVWAAAASRWAVEAAGRQR